MTDLIERDKALSIFIEGDGDDDFTTGYNFAVNEYRQKIAHLPTVNPWIPCCERMHLPEYPENIMSEKTRCEKCFRFRRWNDKPCCSGFGIIDDDKMRDGCRHFIEKEEVEME